MLRGRLISCSACVIAVVASPRETPGARLKDRFTTGNWPRRLMASGALRSSRRVKAESGTWVVLPDAAVAHGLVADALVVGVALPNVRRAVVRAPDASFLVLT